MPQDSESFLKMPKLSKRRKGYQLVSSVFILEPAVQRVAQSVVQLVAKSSVQRVAQRVVQRVAHPVIVIARQLLFLLLVSGFLLPDISKAEGLPDISKAKGLWLNEQFSSFYVLDGDTWQADFDNDGQQRYRERIRLAYVDTPELAKGTWNRADGLKAKRFFNKWLSDRKNPLNSQTKVSLWLPQGLQRGRYERLIALVCLKGNNINLALIQKGWSALYTNYQVPRLYHEWLQAEAGAFEARRGIWQNTYSRKSYLQHLAKNERTVHSKQNKFYRGVHQLGEWDNLANFGKKFADSFVELKGKVVKIDKQSVWGAQPLTLYIGSGHKTESLAVHFSADALRRGAHVLTIKVGQQIKVDGWLQAEADRYWLQAHYVIPTASALIKSAQQAEECRPQS